LICNSFFIFSNTPSETGNRFAATGINRRFITDFRFGNSGSSRRLQFIGVDQDPGTVAARDNRLSPEDFDESLGGNANSAASATLLFDQDHRGSTPFGDAFIVGQQFPLDAGQHLGAKGLKASNLAGALLVTRVDCAPLGVQLRAGFGALLFGIRQLAASLFDGLHMLENLGLVLRNRLSGMVHLAQ
jgi:hypothetical protein